MKKIKFNFFQYVWIFIASCYLGYALETLWCLVKNGYIESRKSLVLGHLSVAYGMGAVLITLILVHFQNTSSFKVFWISVLSGTVVEYICSLGQEILFHTVAWDYSHMPFNINGRVCLLYSLFWGVFGVLWVRLVIPIMDKAFQKIRIKDNINKIIIFSFIAFFVFDGALSAAAAFRMNARDAGKPASNSVAVWLDKHYPDDKMHKIYANSGNAKQEREQHIKEREKLKP